jgi:hypothetical protein
MDITEGHHSNRKEIQGHHETYLEDDDVLFIPKGWIARRQQDSVGSQWYNC